MAGSDSEYLMIEDNSFDVQIFLFDFANHEIVKKFKILRNATAALDYLFTEDGSLRVEPPKVIFLDLHMPKMNGVELLQRIKSNERTKGIPVVVLKSSISPREVRECQQLGVHDYIDKPLQYEGVVNAINKFSACF